MASIVQEVLTAFTYGEEQVGAGALTPDAIELMWRAKCDWALAKLQAPLSHGDATQVIRSTCKSSMPSDFARRVIAHVNGIVEETAQNVVPTQGERQTLQSCLKFSDYIAKDSWALLSKPSTTVLEQAHVLRNTAFAIGLFYPNEPTYVAMTAVLVAVRNGFAYIPNPTALLALDNVKQTIRERRAESVAAFTGPRPHYYPDNVADFQFAYPELYARAYPVESNQPGCCPLDATSLFSLQSFLPARRTKKSACAFEHAAHGPWRMHSAAGAELLAGEQLGLPGLRIFPPRHAEAFGAMSPALGSPMLENSARFLVAPPLALGDVSRSPTMPAARTETTPIESLALEDAPMSTSPKKKSIPDATVSEPHSAASTTKPHVVKKRPAGAISGCKLPFPGKPREGRQYLPMELGDWRIYTDMKNSSWRAMRLGEKKDIKRRWATDAERAWDNLMSEIALR